MSDGRGLPGEFGRSAVSAELHQALFEENTDGMLIVDEHGSCVAVNRRIAEMTGQPRERLVGMRLTDLIAQQDESAIRRRDGGLIPVEIRMPALTEGHLLVVVRDLTGSKQLEAVREALRESEERLRQAVRVSHIGIFDHDHLTGSLYYSPEQREICGLEADEPISFVAPPGNAHGTWDLAHPEDQERVAAALRAAHNPAGDGLFDLDHRIIRRDGSVRWLTTRSQTFFAGEGSARRPVRTVGAVHDITSLKDAEQALSENEDRLRQVIDVSNIGVFEHDHVAKTMYLSSSMREFVGLGQDEPVSGSRYERKGPEPAEFLKTVHPEDRDRVAAKIERAHREGGIYDEEHRLLRRDGSVRWINIRSRTTVEGEGDSRRPVRTIGAMFDISERKDAEEERQRLQAQLVQAQKMESIGRLAGGVAHDFNNMLNVICGYAELALEQLDPTNPLHVAVDEIRKAGRRSAELTSQLLAFARKQPIAPKVINLNEHIERSLNMVRRLIGENIRPVWMPGLELWPVRVDPIQIDQILVNLLLNSRDAIAGFGHVTIVTTNVVLDHEQCKRHPGSVPGAYVALQVTDDGGGMDAETKSHLFEPFYTTKADGHGTGLGLATVYGIVLQNKGFIIVSSEVGRGTSVQVLLPRFTGAVARPVVVPSTAERLKKGTETVLLVEDEPMVLGLSKHMLETLGYTVLPAGTPNEALRLAREQGGGIHLLLTDVVMPDMNGPELARQLVSMYPHLKCMFVSGYFSSSTRGVLDEGSHFLQKPFSVTDLANRVRDALEAP